MACIAAVILAFFLAFVEYEHPEGTAEQVRGAAVSCCHYLLLDSGNVLYCLSSPTVHPFAFGEYVRPGENSRADALDSGYHVCWFACLIFKPWCRLA